MFIKSGKDKIKFLILLGAGFVLVSCKPKLVANPPFKSCKGLCASLESDPLASKIIHGDYRCHLEITKALKQVQGARCLL